MRINATNIAAMGTVIAVAVTLLAAVGSGIYQISELNNRVDHLSAEVEQLATRDEVRILVAEEIRILVAEEIRRGNRILLHSLANHKHDENGNALFTIPPGSEPTGENRQQ